ncbi:MAG TPA: phosphotransferase family protein [Acidimicrobiia bacterium]|nr:phosphotransferase family protein [Acidimicrobiia bacterium]
MGDDAGTVDELPRDALEGWLAGALDVAAVHIGGFSKPRSGFSAETWIFDAEILGDGPPETRRLVVRRETDDPAVYPQQAPGYDCEVEIQYRTMKALADHSEVPIAPLVGYEDDPSVLGAPFFVMGFVDGEVPVENPLYTAEGFFVDAPPERRRGMIEDGLRVLARVHDVDWRDAGMEWLAPPDVVPGSAHQVDLWEAYARRELAGRGHPVLEHGFAWLHRRLPDRDGAEDRTIGLCWGDARPGNMIWQGTRCVCATDFEAASIASPDQDLGWWLMFDRWSHETFGVGRLDGEPTRDEQRRIYAEWAGVEVPDTTFHEVFAAVRYTAIVVRVMNRTVARGLLPPDQTIWIDNPSTLCLSQILDEVG